MFKKKKKISKILVIRFSSLGDVVLTTVLFKELYDTFPEAQITFVTSQEFVEVVSNNPYIHQVFGLDRSQKLGVKELGKDLKTQQFDLVYDAHSSLRSRSLVRMLKRGFQLIRIRKYGWKRTLLTRFKIDLMPQRSFRQMLLAPLAKWATLSEQPTSELFLSQEMESDVQAQLQQAGVSLTKPLIALAPGASFEGKKWSLDSFSTLGEQLLIKGYDLIILGGAEDQEAWDLQDNLGGDVACFAGIFSILESATALKFAKLAVSNDSSVVHLAESVKTPVIALFGPTVKQWGYAPFLPQSHVLEVDLPCRPCSRTGQGRCQIQEDRLCLHSISPAEVLKVIETHF